MWFVYWDACGLACFLFGEFTLLYANYAILTEVVTPWMGWQSPYTWANVVVWETMLLLAHWSHWMAALTPPGHVVKGQVSSSSRSGRSSPLSPPRSTESTLSRPQSLRLASFLSQTGGTAASARLYALRGLTTAASAACA
jgi:hypothetical protein